jgi:hypothetical protein
VVNEGSAARLAEAEEVPPSALPHAVATAKPTPPRRATAIVVARFIVHGVRMARPVCKQGAMSFFVEFVGGWIVALSMWLPPFASK